jgi:hypothetical protein
MFGYRIQHRLNRRVRDEAQHLRGGNLLCRRLNKALMRVVDLLSVYFELLLELGAGLAGTTDARLRSSFAPSYVSLRILV